MQLLNELALARSQDNTPTENVVALYDAIHEYGKYAQAQSQRDC